MLHKSFSLCKKCRNTASKSAVKCDEPNKITHVSLYPNVDFNFPYSFYSLVGHFDLALEPTVSSILLSSITFHICDSACVCVLQEDQEKYYSPRKKAV